MTTAWRTMPGSTTTGPGHEKEDVIMWRIFQDRHPVLYEVTEWVQLVAVLSVLAAEIVRWAL